MFPKNQIGQNNHQRFGSSQIAVNQHITSDDMRKVAQGHDHKGGVARGHNT
jgi:hypothetical protein